MSAFNLILQRASPQTPLNYRISQPTYSIGKAVKKRAVLYWRNRHLSCLEILLVSYDQIQTASQAPEQLQLLECQQGERIRQSFEPGNVPAVFQ